ncbi:putative RNA-binding protein RbpD [Hippocampus zosterae]|uniref:putative RNA-binding protein RbpD n=1 Tax=Hippocampus zosterae TaxID=109293 RepID=UPI00223D2C82|nr:putative RNA-binding protein RbpD [Hippocampus zosterae]
MLGQEEPEQTSIHIGNLPPQARPQDLYSFFSTFGEIKAIEIPSDTSGRPRGFGFVQFEEQQDAMSAIDNYDRTEFMGKTVRVRRARPLEARYAHNKAVWHSEEWLQANQRGLVGKMAPYLPKLHYLGKQLRYLESHFNTQEKVEEYGEALGSLL